MGRVENFPNEWPETPAELVAMAVKNDVLQRLETAMAHDKVIANFLSARGATVTLDVVVDRDLGPGGMSFESGSGDGPFSPVLGQPAVAAMITVMRERILAGDAPSGDVPFAFEIAFNPDEMGRLEA
jgi:hypothetical protein